MHCSPQRSVEVLKTTADECIQIFLFCDVEAISEQDVIGM